MEKITAESLRESNKAFRLPDVPHLAERLAEMRALADTGAEHAMVVDWHTGDVLWRTRGNALNVDLSDAYHKGLTQGNLTIHTHPAAAECSVDDAVATTMVGARAGIAVCADGTTSITGRLTCSPLVYSLCSEYVYRAARLAYGIDADKCRAHDPIEVARDNRALAQAVQQQGWCSMWMTHYSDALIAAMPTQGE